MIFVLCIHNSCIARGPRGLGCRWLTGAFLLDHCQCPHRFTCQPLVFFFSTERPLHHSEKILEQVLEWSTLESPSSAFLVIKKFAAAKKVAGGKGMQVCYRW